MDLLSPAVKVDIVGSFCSETPDRNSRRWKRRDRASTLTKRWKHANAFASNEASTKRRNAGRRNCCERHLASAIRNSRVVHWCARGVFSLHLLSAPRIAKCVHFVVLKMLQRSLRCASFRQQTVRLVWNTAEKQKQDAPEAASSFMFEDLQVELVPESRQNPKPDPSKLVFGRTFSDHMLRVDWTEAKGWAVPKISGLHNIELHPAAKVFHYAQELFEGMKAFRGYDEKVRLFRPHMNVRRLLNSAARLGLPVFQPEEFLRCILKLVSIDKDWVPKYPLSSLYIRPTLIGTEPSLGVARSNEAVFFVITGPVGPYYSTGIKPVSLLADPQYVRAWPGGTGDKKLGCNYAPTLMVQAEAEKQKLQQVLWLFGEDEQITEVGAMNVFILLKNKSGETELVTPPLSGIILPGVTRQSVLDLTREWNEFKVSERKITMAEVREALKEKRILEMFGSGTACVICPVGRIVHRGEDLHIPTMEQENAVTTRILKAITDIQYGVVPHSWAVEVH